MTRTKAGEEPLGFMDDGGRAAGPWLSTSTSAPVLASRVEPSVACGWAAPSDHTVEPRRADWWATGGSRGRAARGPASSLRRAWWCGFITTVSAGCCSAVVPSGSTEQSPAVWGGEPGGVDPAEDGC
jgi:hypothetical protein